MTDSGDETRRAVAVDPHALQGYSTYPDPYSDLRRDYARVCAERDGLRVAVEQLRAALLPLAALDYSVFPDLGDHLEFDIQVSIGDVRRARALLQSSPISSMMISEP